MTELDGQMALFTLDGCDQHIIDAMEPEACEECCSFCGYHCTSSKECCELAGESNDDPA